jgi:hypothetical protein
MVAVAAVEDVVTVAFIRSPGTGFFGSKVTLCSNWTPAASAGRPLKQ